MPSYHPSYMHNGYPPEAPTVSTPTPTPIPSPSPSPTPSPAPVTLNHHTQTGRVTGPIPRPFGRTSCEKHRKLHVRILLRFSSSKLIFFRDAVRAIQRATLTLTRRRGRGGRGLRRGLGEGGWGEEKAGGRRHVNTRP